MAYNNGFPAGYQAYFTPQVPQAPQSGIIWVSGEAGAKSYLVAPNNTVQLWDSEAQVIYLKSADASGMPSMKVLDYTIRPQPRADGAGAVLGQQAGALSAKDIEGLQAQIDELRADIKAMKEAEHAE